MSLPIVHNHYPALLSPLKVGRFELRNRAIMGAMHTGIEKLGTSINPSTFWV